jgi:hypothetical protein
VKDGQHASLADLGLEDPRLQMLGPTGTRLRCGHDLPLHLIRTIRSIRFPEHQPPQRTGKPDGTRSASAPRGLGQSFMIRRRVTRVRLFEYEIDYLFLPEHTRCRYFW